MGIDGALFVASFFCRRRSALFTDHFPLSQVHFLKCIKYFVRASF
jgi:hypothetical protein